MVWTSLALDFRADASTGIYFVALLKCDHARVHVHGCEGSNLIYIYKYSGVDITSGGIF